MSTLVEAAGPRTTWAAIDLEALSHNLRLVRAALTPGTQVMAIVKGDAYGHGAVACTRRLAREGSDWFGVAVAEEGMELRKAGITKPILCLGGFWEGQEEACLRSQLVPAVSSIDSACAIDRAARGLGLVAGIHVKIDTGMNRMGWRYDHASELADALTRLPNIRVDGLMTHLASGEDTSPGSFSSVQISRFQNTEAMFRAKGFQPAFRHMANSAALFASTASHGNLVRPGGALYGLWRDIVAPEHSPRSLQPVMSLFTRIGLLKQLEPGESVGYGCTFRSSKRMLAAVLPLGYAEGYCRSLSNCGRGLVRGNYARVLGRVSMDITVIDVTGIRGVAVGDNVLMFGRDGQFLLPAEDLAALAGTVSYDITCGIRARVPRTYIDSP